ncbi:ISL3 family transposase [Miniphocaeibacter halophilus]|uniref:ISL3 family transposase n=2 Tax=Miniphocaeibacter halophilus TaxID=2931922 RepID=A0AC61MPG9_9FIRM|nr:ISL3 family transposase [Miniphocaeibacter halophilus]QQK07432.1 ISL3 family transposase [Miniphocaeibacter halophilus]QQK08401.1 ISL3 family transposase [Miniphocaeibacter halophilus]
MSTSNYILDFLGIKDKNIKFIKFSNNMRKNNVTYKVIDAKLSYTPNVCPICGNMDKNAIIKHGNKISNIKLLPLNGDPTILKLRKQRFFCKECSHTFTAKTNIVEKNCFISNRVKLHITENLTMKISQKDIARLNYVSSNTVSRSLEANYKAFRVNKSYLPETLCFDEFKSTKDAKGSMSFIFCNGDRKNFNIIDIVENRTLPYLTKYFRKFTYKARANVKYICIDIYKPYMSLIKDVFPNAQIVLDKFHIVNLIGRALLKTRIEIMKNFSTSSIEYKRLKRYWKLIQKDSSKLDIIHFSKWTHFNKWKSTSDVVNETIAVDDNLKKTYEVYQILLSDIRCENSKRLREHLTLFKDTVSEQMEVAINTLLKYFEYVKNTLSTNITNGPLEGTNNLIKSIKRIVFGYRSFYNFRNRVFIIKNLMKPIKNYQATI